MKTQETFTSPTRGQQTIWLETADGMCIYYAGGWNMQYDHHFDMEKLCESDDSTLPTINDLIASGDLHVHHCAKEYIFIAEGDTLASCEAFTALSDDMQDEYREVTIIQALAFFKERGYDVTRDALYHNITAWASDYKSGYRDEDNGYWLFTPCGHNRLSITLERLHALGKAYQLTYIA